MSDYYYDDFEVDDDGILRDSKSEGGIIIDDDGIVRDEGDRLSHQTLPDSGLGAERKSSTSTINYKLQGRHMADDGYMDDSARMEEKSLHISDLEDSQQEFSFDHASLGSRDADVFRSENNLHTTSEDMFSDLNHTDDLDKLLSSEKFHSKLFQGYDGDVDFDGPGIMEEELPPGVGVDDDDEDFPIYSPVASRRADQNRASNRTSQRHEDTLYLIPQGEQGGNSLLDFEQLEAHLKADQSMLGDTGEMDPIQQYLLGLEQQEAYDDSVSVSERSDNNIKLSDSKNQNRTGNDSNTDDSYALQTRSSLDGYAHPDQGHDNRGQGHQAYRGQRDLDRDRELDKEVRQALSEAMFTEDEEEEEQSLSYGNMQAGAVMADTLQFGEALASLNSNPQNQGKLSSPPASRKSTPLPGSSRIPVYSRSPSPTRAKTSNSRPSSGRVREQSPSSRIPSPTRGSYARVSSPSRVPTPTRGQSPVRNQSPTQIPTPNRMHSPTRPATPTRTHSHSRPQTPTRIHSPIRGGQTPNGRTTGRIPTPTRIQSPTRLPSPVRERSPRTTSPIRSAGHTRIPTPTKGLGKISGRSASPERKADAKTSDVSKAPTTEGRRRQLPSVKQRTVSPVPSESDSYTAPRRSHTPNSHPQNSDPPNSQRPQSPNNSSARSKSGYGRSHTPNSENNQNSTTKSPYGRSHTPNSHRPQSPNDANSRTKSPFERSHTPRDSESRSRAPLNHSKRQQESPFEERADLKPHSNLYNEADVIDEEGERSESPLMTSHNQRSEVDAGNLGLPQQARSSPALRNRSPALRAYLSKSPGPNSKRTMSPSLRGYMSPLSFAGGGPLDRFNNGDLNGDLDRKDKTPVQNQNNSDNEEQIDKDYESQGNGDSKNGTSVNKAYKKLVPSAVRPVTPKSFKIRSQNNGAVTKGPLKATVDTLPETPFYESDDHSSFTSEKSRGELTARLKREHMQRQETTNLVHQLQQDYDELLAKHAGAELTIDQLRLEAKVNLHYDAPPPARIIMGPLSAPQVPQNVSLGQSMPAPTISGGGQSQPQRALLSDASGATHQNMTDSAVGPDGGLEDDAGAESMKMALMFQSEGLREKIESFGILLNEDQLTPEEQEKVYGNIKSDYEKLQSDYREACQSLDLMRRQGTGTGDGFDDDKAISGSLFQLERNIDALHEHVEDNVKMSRNRRQPFMETTSAAQTPTASRAATPRNVTASPSVLDIIDSDVEADLRDKIHQLHNEYDALMEQYRRLKERPPTVQRDGDIDRLIDKLKLIYDASPPDKKPSPIPPELWDRIREESAGAVPPVSTSGDPSVNPHDAPSRHKPTPPRPHGRRAAHPSDDSYDSKDDSFAGGASALPYHKKQPRRQFEEMDSGFYTPNKKAAYGGHAEDMDSGYTEGSRMSEARARSEPKRHLLRGELTYGEDSTDSVDVGGRHVHPRGSRRQSGTASIHSERSHRRRRKTRDTSQITEKGQSHDATVQAESRDSYSEYSSSTETSSRVRALADEVQRLKSQLENGQQPYPYPYPYQYPYPGYDYNGQGQYPGYYGYYGNYDNQNSGAHGDDGQGRYDREGGHPDGYDERSPQARRRSHTPTPHRDDDPVTPPSALRRRHSFSGSPTHPPESPTYDQPTRAPSRGYYYQDSPERSRTPTQYVRESTPIRQPSRAHYQGDYAYDERDYAPAERYYEYPTERTPERDYYHDRRGRERSRERRTSPSPDRRRHRSSSRGSRNRSPSRRYPNNNYYQLSYADGDDYDHTGAAHADYYQDRAYRDNGYGYYDDANTRAYYPPPQPVPAAEPTPVVTVKTTACPMCGGQGQHTHTDYVYQPPPPPQPAETCCPMCGSVSQHTHSNYVFQPPAQPAQPQSPQVTFVQPANSRGAAPVAGRYYVQGDITGSPQPRRQSRSLRRTQSLPRNSGRRRRGDEEDDDQDSDVDLLEVTRTAQQLKILSRQMREKLSDELDASYREAYHTKYL